MVRSKLFEKLDEATTHTLTLVSAPAGSGKTTLVSAWVQSIRKKLDIHVAWLSLDAGDNSIDTFLDYLIGSLEESGVSFDEFQSVSDDIIHSAPTKKLSGINHLIKNTKREFILVLDDYHLIQNQKIHSIISNFFVHPSHLFHLILLTRSDPPFELGRMRLAGRLTEIRMENLQFSDADAMKYLNHMLKVPLAARDIEILNVRTEGWIAGLQLAAISLRNQKDTHSFVNSFAGNHRFVFDYLLEQVLIGQPEDVKSFLLKTSILGRFSYKLCDGVLQSNTSRQILDILERDNLFLIPLDDERGWYRYHQLFADLLKLMLNQTYPGLAVELHHRASAWFEDQGMIADALEHALAAEDMELTTRLISENVLALVEYAELSPILHRMNAIPSEKRKLSPWLNVAYAWALAYSGQIDRAEKILREIEENPEKISSDELNRINGHLKVVRAYLAWVIGRQSEAIELTQMAEKLLPESEISVRAMNLVTMGNSLNQYSPNWRAVEVLEQAVGFARQAQRPHVYMLAASALAYALIILGQLDQAMDICKEAIDVADQYKQSTGQPLYSIAVIFAEISKIQCEWGKWVEAFKNAHKGTVLANRWAQSDSLVVCILNEVNALIFLNEMQEAYSLIQKAKRISTTISPWFISNVEQFEIFYWLEVGDPKKAELIARNSAGEIPVALKARIYLALNNFEQAQFLIEQSLSDDNSIVSIDSCRMMLILALIFLKKNQLDKALVFLEKTLNIAQERDLIQLFMFRNTEMEPLLNLALKKKINTEFTRKLLSQYASSPYKIEIPKDQDFIEPFSDRELQVLSLLNSPFSTPEIAEQLFISSNTVRTHIKKHIQQIECTWA